MTGIEDREHARSKLSTLAVSNRGRRELQVLKLSLLRRLLSCLFGSGFLFGLLLRRRFAAFK